MLATDPPRVTFTKLPEAIRWQSTTRSYELAERGKPWERPRPPKATLLTRMRRSAKFHVKGLVDPDAFGETQSNPGSDRVRTIFQTLAYPDIFVTIRPGFTTRWGAPIAHDFIPVTLDAVVNRRNQVAHTANITGISRRDLNDGQRFIGALVETLEIELRSHVRALQKSCR